MLIMLDIAIRDYIIPSSNAKNMIYYSKLFSNVFYINMFKIQFGLNHCKCIGQQVIKWIISRDIIPTGIGEKIYISSTLTTQIHHYLDL